MKRCLALSLVLALAGLTVLIVGSERGGDVGLVSTGEVDVELLEAPAFQGASLGSARTLVEPAKGAASLAGERVELHDLALDFIDPSGTWVAPFEVRVVVRREVPAAKAGTRGWRSLDDDGHVALDFDAELVGQYTLGFAYRDAKGRVGLGGADDLRLAMEAHADGVVHSIGLAPSYLLEGVRLRSSSGVHTEALIGDVEIKGYVIPDLLAFEAGRATCAVDLPAHGTYSIDVRRSEGERLRMQGFPSIEPFFREPERDFEPVVTITLDRVPRRLVLDGVRPQDFEVALGERATGRWTMHGGLGQHWLPMPASGELEADRFVDFIPFAAQVRHRASGLVVASGTWSTQPANDWTNIKSWSRFSVGAEVPAVETLRLAVPELLRVRVDGPPEVPWSLALERSTPWERSVSIGHAREYPEPNVDVTATPSEPVVWLAPLTYAVTLTAPALERKLGAFTPRIDGEVLRLELPGYEQVAGRVGPGFVGRVQSVLLRFDNAAEAGPALVDAGGRFVAFVRGAAGVDPLQALAAVQIAAGSSMLEGALVDWSLEQGEVVVDDRIGTADFDLFPPPRTLSRGGYRIEALLPDASARATRGGRALRALDGERPQWSWSASRTAGLLLVPGTYRLVPKNFVLADPVTFEVRAGEATSVTTRYRELGCVRLSAPVGTRLELEPVELAFRAISRELGPFGKWSGRAGRRPTDQTLGAGRWILRGELPEELGGATLTRELVLGSNERLALELTEAGWAVR